MLSFYELTDFRKAFLIFHNHFCKDSYNNVYLAVFSIKVIIYMIIYIICGILERNLYSAFWKIFLSGKWDTWILGDIPKSQAKRSEAFMNI